MHPLAIGLDLLLVPGHFLAVGAELVLRRLDLRRIARFARRLQRLLVVSQLRAVLLQLCFSSPELLAFDLDWILRGRRGLREGGGAAQCNAQQHDNRNSFHVFSSLARSSRNGVTAAFTQRRYRWRR